MHHKYNHLMNMPLGERALFRAGHIYVLFSSFIHIMLGTYAKIRHQNPIKQFQYIGSIFLLIATSLIIISFFLELPSDNIERTLCRFGIYFTLAGVLFHSIINLFKNKDE